RCARPMAVTSSRTISNGLPSSCPGFPDDTGEKMKRSLAAFLLVCLAGCGASGSNPTNIIQVSGKAVAPDGTPARSLTLNFHPTAPGGTTAYGLVGADGRFTPKTLNNQKGIIPGTYKVSVDPMPNGTKVSQRCTSEVTTDIQVQVSPGDTELVVRLK